MNTILFTVVLAVIVLYLLKVLRPNSNWPPGPMNLPVLGYLPFLDVQSPFVTLSKLAEKYGDVFAIRMGNLPCLVLADATLVRRYFARKEFCDRAPLFLTHGVMEGYGLICAEGWLWTRHRRLVFEFMRRIHRHDAFLRQLTQKCVNTCLAELLEHVGHEQRLDSMSHHVGNFMNRLVFGLEYDRDDYNWQRIQSLRAEGVREMSVSGIINFVPWLRHFWPGMKRKLKWIIDGKYESHAEYHRVTLNKMDKMQKIDNVKEDHDNNDFVDMTQFFLEERQKLIDDAKFDEAEHFFSMKQLHHLQGDIFGAGVDTTITTLNWCFLYLSIFPDIQQRLHQDVVRVCGQSGEIQHEHRSNLASVEAFILEVQRLRPVVPLGVPHGTSTRTKVEGFDVSEGTMIIPLHWYINRRRDVWGEDAHEFCIDRFIDQDRKIKKNEHLMPFQSGRRRCVGEELGQTLAFLFVATAVQKYELCLGPNDFGVYDLDQNHELGFTYCPKPFEMVLKARQGS